MGICYGLAFGFYILSEIGAWSAWHLQNPFAHRVASRQTGKAVTPVAVSYTSMHINDILRRKKHKATKSYSDVSARPEL